MFLTVKIFVAINFFYCVAFANIHHSILEKYSDKCNNAYFVSANTTANAAFLNKEEKLAIHILNPARPSPCLFAAKVPDPLTRKRYSHGLVSLINRMNDISILKIIYPLQEISEQAKKETTNNAINSQTEITQQVLNTIMLSCQNNDPVQLIINLLINAKYDLKTAINFCLEIYNYEDISMQLTFIGYKSAIRFNNDSEVKNAVVANTSKKFTTQWGGELNLWDHHLTDGYGLTKAGQVIYKDNDTRAIEKLVTPWLLYYTNTYRKENGLDTLKYDQCLLKAATYQTDYLFNESKKGQQFKLVHTQSPESEWFKGKSPSDRALAAGCKKYCGENALYTTLPTISPDEFKSKQNLNLKAKKIARNMVYDQWHNSKGHRENMLTAGYTCMGVSVAIGKHFQDDACINNSSERTILKNTNSAGWIAFGIQVMAY